MRLTAVRVLLYDFAEWGSLLVRIRLFSLVLGLPMILVLLSAISVFGGFEEPGPFFAWNFSSVTFVAAIALQILFGLSLACPKCGKSPYVIGPSWGSFGFVGKPWPDAICSRCGFDMRNGSIEQTTKS